MTAFSGEACPEGRAERIDPNYRKPFREVAEGLQRSDWRSQGDLNPCRRDESPLS